MGPFWDGNEVWLITAGGVTFAAFPTTYAVMFSSLYSALMLLLFALILRGVTFEYRGKVDNPTYKQVCGGKTGHYEAIEVTYDPAKTTYEAVARLFFEIHDPTQSDRQGPDVGEQYRSAVFYTSDQQEQTALKLIGILKDKGYAVVTEVNPAGKFWKAEDYHQDYYQSETYQQVKRYSNILLELIEQGIRTGEIRSGIPAHTIRQCILGSIEHMCLTRVIFQRPIDGNQLTDDLCRVLLDGIVDR